MGYVHQANFKFHEPYHTHSLTNCVVFLFVCFSFVVRLLATTACNRNLKAPWSLKYFVSGPSQRKPINYILNKTGTHEIYTDIKNEQINKWRRNTTFSYSRIQNNKCLKKYGHLAVKLYSDRSHRWTKTSKWRLLKNSIFAYPNVFLHQILIIRKEIVVILQWRTLVDATLIK